MRRSSLEHLIRAVASVTGEEVARVVAEMSKHWETLKQLDSSILTPQAALPWWGQ
jgi:adenylosuccinate lyase